MGAIPGTENGDPIQSSLSETNQIQYHSMSITQYPDGYSGFCNSNIINQYGQLIGEYSRLDDELWISKPDEIDDDHHGHDDDMERNEQVLEYQPLSYEYPVQQQEELSKSIQYPLPGEHTPCVNKTSSSLKDSPLDQSHTSSPVSVLRRRSYSSVKKKAPKQRARSENGRFAKSNLCEAFQSSPFDDVAGPILGKHPRTKKVSDLLQSSQTSGTPASSPEQGNSEKSSSWEWEPDPTPKPSTKKRKNHHPKTTVKKCMHCESTKTPQWREGPMGHGTLCNACGVKYKHGRLSQEYRPVKSPTFDPKLHSNIRPDAKKGWKKRAKKCTRCESTPSPWWVGPMGGGEAAVSSARGAQYGHDRISKDNRPSNPPTLDPCLDSTPEQQSPRISMQDSIPEPQQQSPRISLQDFILEQQQQPPEVSMQDSIPEQQQSPRISIQDSFPQPTPEKKQRKTITKKQCIPQPTLEKKQRKTTKKQCMHCESTKTPQWREGPMGVGTLCNACGVQYRLGRLFPEYRPLKSPTYNPALHSHLPKRVQQMRINRNTYESAASRASSSQNL